MKRLHPVYARERMLQRIAMIEADERYKAGLKHPAQVQINAPLALIQVDLKAERRALLLALSFLAGPKST